MLPNKPPVMIHLWGGIFNLGKWEVLPNIDLYSFFIEQSFPSFVQLIAPKTIVLSLYFCSEHILVRLWKYFFRYLEFVNSQNVPLIEASKSNSFFISEQTKHIYSLIFCWCNGTHCSLNKGKTNKNSRTFVVAIWGLKISQHVQWRKCRNLENGLVEGLIL